MNLASTPAPALHTGVVIVGGGQAGLSMSHYLKKLGIDHVVFEKNTAMHAWRDQRWDAFSLVTPNWQCQLPDHAYEGPDPHGFMVKAQIIEYLDAFKAKVDAPIREGIEVRRVALRAGGGFDVITSAGAWTCDQVVVASGGYQKPIIPRFAERLPAAIVQLHSEQYRNPQALPPGKVLVVGSGQSGAQIAEDLHLAGRDVVLAVGGAPRCARFYRGKDVVEWLHEMRYYDMPVHDHPLREGVRDNTNHYVTGRDGGRDIDLRRLASEGMSLYGVLDALDGHVLQFQGNLGANLDRADAVYNGINASIDRFIQANGIVASPAEIYRPVWQPARERLSLDVVQAEISAVVWCIGFEPDFAWLDVPVFNGRGQPFHVRGVTSQRGMYFLGLPWLHTWGSGRFSGVARDACYLAEHIRALRQPLASSGKAVRQPALA